MAGVFWQTLTMQRYRIRRRISQLRFLDSALLQPVCEVGRRRIVALRDELLGGPVGEQRLDFRTVLVQLVNRHSTVTHYQRPTVTQLQEGGTGGEVSEILFFSAKSKRRPSLIYSMQIIPVCLSIVARRKGVSATRRGGSNWTPISLLVGHPCKLFNMSSLLLPGPFGRPTGRPEARLARRTSFVRAEINPRSISAAIENTLWPLTVPLSPGSLDSDG